MRTLQHTQTPDKQSNDKL